MPFVYRLQILLEQRERGLEDAQRELAAKLEELESSKKTLEVLTRKAEEATEAGQRAAAAVTAPSPDPVSVSQLMERVERAKALQREAGYAKDEVIEQRIAVQDAEDAVEESRNRLADAMRAVEVLRKHRQRAQDKYRRSEGDREAAEMDEAGVAVFNRRRQA